MLLYVFLGILYLATLWLPATLYANLFYRDLDSGMLMFFTQAQILTTFVSTCIILKKLSKIKDKDDKKD